MQVQTHHGNVESTSSCVQGVRAAIDKGIEAYLEEYVAELETLLRHRDMRDLYKHLKMTAGLGGKKTEGQQAIKDENGDLLRDKGDILRRWERFFGNLLNTKSPTLQPSIVEKVQQRRKAPQPPPPGARSQIEEPISLEAEPTYAETQKAVRAMANWKAPGADSLPVELLKLDDPTREPVVLKHFHAILFPCTEKGGNPTGVERRNDQGGPQKVGPI